MEKRKTQSLLKEDVYCERHHIIPKSLGGSNNKDNIINLTPREHFMAHLLLTKMVEDQESYIKMNWALHKMCFSGRIYFSSRDYEWYRKRHVKFLSENHHSKRIDGWNKMMSDIVFDSWQNNEKRRKRTSEKFKQIWQDEKYRDSLIASNRQRAKQGGEAAKLAMAKRLEYKGKIYIGYKELYEATGVSKFLYKKYYLKGFDPSDRIGCDGPVPTNYIPKLLDNKENQ